MRKPEYLSPTSLDLFYKDREQYYMQYLSDNKLKKDAQTVPMAIGSSFDAYIKADLYKRLVNKGDTQFTFEALFETQVESQNRDVVRKDGEFLYKFYQSCGALTDLMLDMNGCIGEPRFETKIEGKIRLDLHDVPLLGKPDLYFITKDGARIVFDFKVNGFYSNHPHSPKPGYKRCRPTGEVHKNYWPHKHNGYEVNVQQSFEDTDEMWATQLSTYAWLLGEAIGEKTILAVDQIACNNVKKTYRVAQHRAIASRGFQEKTFRKYETMWKQIQDGHIFDDLPREESDRKCKLFDSVSTVLQDPESKACL